MRFDKLGVFVGHDEVGLVGYLPCQLIGGGEDTVDAGLDADYLIKADLRTFLVAGLEL